MKTVKKLNTDEVIRRLKSVHGDKYSYQKVFFKSCREKITITCPIHGDFEMLPFSAFNGSGCPFCAGKGRTTESIVNEFKEILGEEMDYSKVVFENMQKKVTIICPKHGEFQQVPSKIIHRKYGCPKCGVERRTKNQFKDNDFFINKSREVHNDFYDYSEVEYTCMRNKVEIVCPKHGSFFQYPFDHINGHGCPRCGIIKSDSECEIYNELCKYIDSSRIIKNDRDILNGKEIDILLPDFNIGIEYNGLLWHSEEYLRDKNYHKEKMILANSKGIKLIQVFEDEYKKNKDLVIKKILHIIGISNNKERIMGRKCTIKEINKKESYDFLEKNHIQGKCSCSFSYGCFYKNVLIGVMLFLKTKEDKYELVRYATNDNYICNGVGGKLFKHFIKEKNPSEVKTFADLRWTVNRDTNFYTKIGFREDKILNPEYRYIKISKPSERIHKFNFRKKLLNKRYSIDINKSETEITKELGYSKIWDCGMIRYIWKKEE